MPIRSGRLEHRGQPLEGGVGEEDADLLTEQPLPDGGVAVAVRAELRFRVVDVEATQPFEPDAGVDVGDGCGERPGVRDVDAGREPVT